MSVIDKARADRRIQALLGEIASQFKIKYERRNDGGWSSSIREGRAIVDYSGCKHPSASLAHELLHLRTQLRGYKRMRVFISSIDQTPKFKTLMDALDNELQHHKFYKSFLGLGFSPEQFYRDSDVDTEHELRQVLKHPFMNIVEVVPQYLTAIAPAGHMESHVREEMKRELKLIEGGRFWSQLDRIEKAVFEWSESESYDAIPVVREIMLAIQPDHNLTWIGFDEADRPPEKGFFVGEAFEVRPPSEQMATAGA